MIVPGSFNAEAGWFGECLYSEIRVQPKKDLSFTQLDHSFLIFTVLIIYISLQREQTNKVQVCTTKGYMSKSAHERVVRCLLEFCILVSECCIFSN